MGRLDKLRRKITTRKKEEEGGKKYSEKVANSKPLQPRAGGIMAESAMARPLFFQRVRGQSRHWARGFDASLDRRGKVELEHA